MPRIQTPNWLSRWVQQIVKALPSVYGPRGMVMLGQSGLCASFGLAYVGVIETPPLPGVGLVSMMMPLPLWGVAWFLCSFTLAVAAFKVDQAKALGGVTAMLVLWSISYLYYFFTTPVVGGYLNLSFLSAALLGSMVLNAIGISRMLNHAPTHSEVFEAPGDLDAK